MKKNKMIRTTKKGFGVSVCGTNMSSIELYQCSDINQFKKMSKETFVSQYGVRGPRGFCA